jgi:hypothetical protein
MAFEKKRFCFNLNCKITEDEYKDESNFKNGTYGKSNGGKTKFKTCTNCIIADFCGKTCQEQVNRNRHVFRRLKDNVFPKTVSHLKCSPPKTNGDTLYTLIFLDIP